MSGLVHAESVCLIFVMAVVLQPPVAGDSRLALEELEVLRDAISDERVKLVEANRRWLLSQASEPSTARRHDAEYTSLLEKQNALLKQRIENLEVLNHQLSDEKARILQVAVPSRPLNLPPTSVLSTELSRVSEQCRQLRRTEEQYLRELSAKDNELATLRTQVEELQLTLRTKVEDIAQLTRMKTEAASRARRTGDSEHDRLAEERRKAVEDLITSKALAERLQRDLAAVQQENRTQVGELRDMRAELAQCAARESEVEEAILNLPDIPEVGDGAVDKIYGAAQALRKSKADLTAEITKRLGAELDAKEKVMLLSRRAEAEERLKSDTENLRKDLEDMQARLQAQIAAASHRETMLEERAAAAERRQSIVAEDSRSDDESIAERLAMEELLSDAQARMSELERREQLHNDEVQSVRESQQKAQIALAHQLALSEAALTEERAQVTRLTSERERLWAEAARKRTELPVVSIDRGALKTMDRDALFAQLQEVFFAEACARLLSQ